MTNAFVAAQTFTVSAQDIKCEVRAYNFALPAVLHCEKDRSDWKHSASEFRVADFEGLHQADPSRLSSMSARAPDIKLAQSEGNAYAVISDTQAVLTADKYAGYQWIAREVYTLLTQASGPISSAEIACAIGKQFREQVKSLKPLWFDATVSDVLRDLTLYGLAQASSLKPHKNNTKYLCVDPNSIVLAEGVQLPTQSDAQVARQKSERKSRAKKA